MAKNEDKRTDGEKANDTLTAGAMQTVLVQHGRGTPALPSQEMVQNSQGVWVVKGSADDK